MIPKEAIEYLKAARFANYSGQIVEQKGGKDHLIVCEVGRHPSEVAPKRANEYAEALVALLNSTTEAYFNAARLKQERDRLYTVCERLHALLDMGAIFNHMTVVDGKTVLAMLHDAMEGPTDE